MSPNVVLADEPTTALDVVVQRGILMMLMRLQKQLKNTMVIVSHDMGVHYQITHRMAIMYSGSVIELGPTEDIFNDPIHPYTQMLGKRPAPRGRQERQGRHPRASAGPCVSPSGVPLRPPVPEGHRPLPAGSSPVP